MALVVFLRGVNVGGHRTFRPSVLAQRLSHLGAVNIGAAGTLVIRQRVPRAQLRAELARELPFDTHIVICDGRQILEVMSLDVLDDYPARSGIVRFVSVLSGPPRETPLPVRFPPDGQWLVEVFARHGRFAIGRYRRHLKTIGYLGRLDRLFGVPVTTRNFNTVAAIARVLESGGPA